MSEQEPAIDLRKVFLYDLARKEAIRDLESATFKAETWNKLEDQERELRKHLKDASNRLEEMLRLIGPEKSPTPKNIT